MAEGQAVSRSTQGSRTSRRARASQLTAAAMLPASLVGAVLVAAPFAGTTTHALAADSRPAAAVAAAPAATTPAATTPAGTPAATDQGTQQKNAATDSSGLNLSVPRDSIRSLVIAYLIITIVGASVIVTAAVRSNDR